LPQRGRCTNWCTRCRKGSFPPGVQIAGSATVCFARTIARDGQIDRFDLNPQVPGTHGARGTSFCIYRGPRFSPSCDTEYKTGIDTTATTWGWDRLPSRWEMTLDPVWTLFGVEERGERR
jgi:hypothetical protein